MMKKIIFSIGIITLISKLTGFVRDLALSYYFGASEVTDAYLVATSIPGTIFNLVGMGLISAYIPICTHLKEKKGDNASFFFTSRLLNFLFIICTVIFLLVFFFTKQIVHIFASGFEGDILNLTVLYTKISIFMIYFNIMTNIFSGLLQIYNKFFLVASLGIPLNIIYILGSYVAYKSGNIYLPITAIIGSAFNVLFLLHPLKKIKYKYSLNFNLKDKLLKRMMYLSIPGMIGGSLEQINYLVDRTIASRVVIGGISILNYASRLNLAVVGLLISPVITVLFPKLASCIALKKNNELKEYIQISIGYILIVSLPITFMALIFSKEIVTIVFGRGEFKDIELTARALSFYTIAFLPIAVRELIVRVFYSFKDTVTPVINSGFGIIMNIVLNLLLSKYIGLSGIALATSLSLIMTSLSLIVLLEKKYKSFSFKEVAVVFIKVLVSTLIMSAVLLYLKTYMLSVSFLFIIFLNVIGIIIYLIILYFMKIKFLNDFILSKTKRNKIL